MKPQFQPDEPFISFVSRSARFLGLSGVGDLVRDVDVPLGAFLKGNRDAITRVAKVLDVDPEAAVFRSFRRIDAQNTQVLNLTLRENRLLRGKSRVCPACLRSDFGPDLTEQTAHNAYARLAWSIAPVMACPKHRVRLMTPPETGVPHEFNQTWEPWFPEIFDGELDQPVSGLGLYESFVLDTLAGGTSAPGWTGHLPLDALGILSEFLGMAKLFGPEVLPSDCSPDDASLALDAGFIRLSQGPEAVEGLLLDLRVRPGLPQQRPQGRYGPIYDWLNRSSGSAPEFEPMKSLLIRHILETWPLKPGRRVLGEWITDRRFHSVLTASDEYDLRPSQVANLLRDAKLEGALDLPEFERIYPADAVDNVLAAVSGSLSYAKAEIQLGMSRTHLQTFVAVGFIQCSLGGDSARPKFAQKDIATFKDRHRDLPVVNAQRLHGSALTIAEAARKHGKSVVDIYRLIIDKTLTGVSVTSDALLFSDIRIDAEELANHFKAGGKEVFLPMFTCSKELSLGSAFIRELSTKGYLDTFDVLDERTHQRKTVMRQHDVLEFGHTFVSRRKLARLNGVKIREVQKRLDKAGLVPVEASGDGKEFLFLREDILPVEGLNKRQEVHEA